MLIVLIGSLAWAGDGFALGVGVQSAPTGPVAQSLRVLGRQTWGAVSVEGLLTGSPWPLQGSEFDALLVRISASKGGDFQQPIAADRASAGALLSWRVAPPVAGGPWLQGGPAVLAGAELRLQETGTLTADEDGLPVLDQDGARLVGGPALGLGFEFDLGARAGARLALTDRMALQPAPVYTPGGSAEGLVLKQSFTLSLDLSLSLSRSTP